MSSNRKNLIWCLKFELKFRNGNRRIYSSMKFWIFIWQSVQFLVRVCYSDISAVLCDLPVILLNRPCSGWLLKIFNIPTTNGTYLNENDDGEIFFVASKMLHEFAKNLHTYSSQRLHITTLWIFYNHSLKWTN